MHSVESLKTLFRERRFWDAPDLQALLDNILSRLENRGYIPTGFIAEFIDGMRGHQFSGRIEKTFYEPCEVIKTTAMEIICISNEIPPEIIEAFPDFYSGGKFHINKARMQQEGFAYHSRHGEFFHLIDPESAIADM